MKLTLRVISIAIISMAVLFSGLNTRITPHKFKDINNLNKELKRIATSGNNMKFEMKKEISVTAKLRTLI